QRRRPDVVAGRRCCAAADRSGRVVDAHRRAAGVDRAVAGVSLRARRRAARRCGGGAPMTDPASRTIDNSSLVELLDRLVETGVVATGDVLLGLADVDLIRVNLQLVLGAVDKLQAGDGARPATPGAQ